MKAAVLWGCWACVCTIPAFAGGTALRGVPVWLNGLPEEKYNIVFVGDGFLEDEQSLFNQKVTESIERLKRFPPYEQYFRAFNFWRINVASSQSGITDEGRQIQRNTAFKTKMMGRMVFSESDGEQAILQAVHDTGFPAESIVILVNEYRPGGSGSQGTPFVYATISSDFTLILTHELGHRIGKLADEYECYYCDGKDCDCTYSTTDCKCHREDPDATRIEPNIALGRGKWSVAPGVSFPTTVDEPQGLVGWWEGGKYHAHKIYRSQKDCHMRCKTSPFCRVCRVEIGRNLQRYLRRSFARPYRLPTASAPGCLSHCGA